MPRKRLPKNSCNLFKLEDKAFPILLTEGDPIQGPHYGVTLPQKDERWDGIQGYSGHKCHICSSDVMTRSGPLEFIGSTFQQTFQWSLCDICYSKGWRIPTFSVFSNVFKLVYKNIKTKETAWVNVLKIIKIKIPRRS